jgi:hypothetical protein
VWLSFNHPENRLRQENSKIYLLDHINMKKKLLKGVGAEHQMLK